MISMMVAAAAVIAFLLVWHYRGGGVAAFLAVLAGCSLSTVDLATFGYSTVLTAVAPTAVTVATFHLALAGAVLALPAQTFRNLSPWFLLFIGSMVVFLFARGLEAPHTVSGVLQWASAVVAWGVGGAVAESARRSGKPTERLIARAVGIVVCWHAAAAALQLLGVRAVTSIEVGTLEIARASGIAGHSANLGKIMFFLILIVLPITLSADRIARRWAVGTIALAAVLTGLSISRANTVAVIVMIGLWLLLGPGMTITKRLFVPLAGFLVALPILDILILRNEYDPEGGARPVLLATAARQIFESFWFGVGPNNYLSVVGQYDALAAGGLPVHSAFLLTLAELGVLTAICVMVPLVLAVLRALRSSRRGAASRPHAVAFLAAVPGIILIAATGWGVLREQYLILMFFAIGYFVGTMRWGSATNDAADLQPHLGRTADRYVRRRSHARGDANAHSRTSAPARS